MCIYIYVHNIAYASMPKSMHACMYVCRYVCPTSPNQFLNLKPSNSFNLHVQGTLASITVAWVAVKELNLSYDNGVHIYTYIGTVNNMFPQSSNLNSVPEQRPSNVRACSRDLCCRRPLLPWPLDPLCARLEYHFRAF